MIEASGKILRSLEYVYLTPDSYVSGAVAQARLALRVTPEGLFREPIRNVESYTRPATVFPANGQLGGGTEVKVPHDISTRGAVWIPIGP